MDFKPNKNKVIVSIVVVVTWYYILFGLFRATPTCPIEIVESGSQPCPKSLCDLPFIVNHVIYGYCVTGCDCYTKLFFNILSIIIPGILAYLIWSLIEKSR
jgi:hypothetical protein